MRQVRRMTFETNSSSTHSITICPQETYEKWMKGQVLYNDWNEDFIEAEELTPYDYEQAGTQYEAHKGKYYKGWNELSEEEKKEYTTEYVLRNKKKNDDDEYLTYSEWCYSHGDLEQYVKHYTTKNGDKIVAFGYYGYDG